MAGISGSCRPSPLLSVTLNDDATFFQHHSSSIDSEKEPWVLASGADNVREVSVRFTLQKEINLHTGLPVAHIDDDAEEQENGDVSLGSGDLELVEDGDTQLVGLRFNEVYLERGTEVRNAYIQFVCDEPSSEPVSLFITAEDSDTLRDSAVRNTICLLAPKSARNWNGNPANGNVTVPQQKTNAPLTSLHWYRQSSIATTGNQATPSPSSSPAPASEQQSPSRATANQLLNSSSTPMNHDQPTRNNWSLIRIEFRLLFGSPQTSQTEIRQFNVSLQGEQVAKEITINPTGPVAERFTEQTFENIMIADELTIELQQPREQPFCQGLRFKRWNRQNFRCTVVSVTLTGTSPRAIAGLTISTPFVAAGIL